MGKKSCKRPNLIKNKFLSACIGTLGIFLGTCFIIPIPGFSVYITSYIHEKQEFVTMHYGFFFNLIFAISTTIGMSLGGFLELKFGFILTTLTGLLIITAADVFMLNVQNIWFCYILIFFISTGSGMSNSLLGKNLALYNPNKKGLIISLLGSIISLLAGVFSITGEKLVNPEGYTLNKTEEYYDYKYSSSTYKYFSLGFFIIPFGAIIFLLFIINFEKEDSKEKESNEPFMEEETKENKNENNNEENKNENNNEENKNDNINEENKNDNINEENKNENIGEKKEDVLEINNTNSKENADINENDNEELLLKKEIKTMNKIKFIKEVIKTLRFWRISIVLLLITFSISFITFTSRTFGALIGIDGNALQFLILGQSGALIVISPILGILIDKKGPLPLIRISTLVCMIPGILLTIFTDNTIVFMISCFLSVLGLISISVCYTPFIMEIYGIETSIILGGIMQVFSKISEIATTTTAFSISLFYSKEEIMKPYKILYIICSSCCLLSFILILFEKKDKYKYDEKEVNSLGKLVSRYTLKPSD